MPTPPLLTIAPLYATSPFPDSCALGSCALIDTPTPHPVYIASRAATVLYNYISSALRAACQLLSLSVWAAGVWE